MAVPPPAVGPGPHAPGWSLRARLRVALAVLAIPAAGFLAYGSWRAYENVRAEGIARAARAAQAAANTSSTFLGLAETLTVAFAGSDPAALLTPASCRDRVVTSRDMLTFFAGLSVVDAEGRLVCSALSVSDPPPVATDREWFRTLMATGSPLVSDPILGRVTGLRVVIVAAPIEDETGAVIGAVSGGIALDELLDLLNLTLADASSRVTLTDGRGVILATNEVDTTGVRLLIDGGVAAWDEGPSWAVFDLQEAGDGRRVFGRAELPNLGWSVYSGFTPDSLFASGYDLALVEALGGLAILLFALLISELAYRDIVGTFRVLASGVQEAAAGRPVRLPKRSPPEVITVAEQFNQTLAARASAEERHRDFLHEAAFGSAVTSEDGRFIEVNPALAHMLGYDSPEELMAAGVTPLYHEPADRGRLTARYREVGQFQGVESTFRRKDGRSVLLRVSGRFVTVDGEGRYELLCEDITRQRQLEDQERHRQKVDAIGRLAGGVSHEFSNILTVIAGNAEFLIEELGVDHPSSETAHAIVKAARDGSAVAASLLAISRAEPVAPVSIDTRGVLSELAETFARLLPRTVRITTDFAPVDACIWMSRGHLEQIVLNLAINARDAMPDGGTIHLATEVGEGGPKGDDGGRLLTVRVRDDGPGIDPAVIDRILEPYFTTKPRGEGTGLGLATVSALVEQAGSRLVVSSELGVGSAFEFALPVVEC